MIKTSTYWLCCMLLMMLLFSCGTKRNEIPSLKETFSKSDKNPFGTYVACRQTGELFYNNEINTKKTSLQTSLQDIADTASLYIVISKNFYLTQDDREAMTNFVSSGNNMFISSENIDTSFLNLIGFSQKYDYKGSDGNAENLRYTGVQLHPAYFYDNSRHNYFYLPLDNAFKMPADSLIKVLGTNEDGQPNFVVVFYGRGHFYLHREPSAFSNYFLLQKNNYQYLQNAFSFFPDIPEHIFWDDYYNKRNFAPVEDGEKSAGKSGFSVLLKYPAMSWAFWLVLLLLLIYILFGSKRRQRIIRPLVPNQNTTVAFTETVSHLYLQKKDNRNIADKMITYLLEHIRSQYFLNTNNLNEEFISTLSRKSNVPYEKVTALFDLIHRIQRTTTVDDQELLLLNQYIENFYKLK